MPLYDFRCTTCGTAFTRLVKMGTTTHDCVECDGNAKQVLLEPPKIDWGAMGAQKNVSPEFIDRFERTHKAQAIKEKKLQDSD